MIDTRFFNQFDLFLSYFFSSRDNDRIGLIWINNVFKGNPAKYLTEIQFPIRE